MIPIKYRVHVLNYVYIRQIKCVWYGPLQLKFLFEQAKAGVSKIGQHFFFKFKLVLDVNQNYSHSDFVIFYFYFWKENHVFNWKSRSMILTESSLISLLLYIMNNFVNTKTHVTWSNMSILWDKYLKWVINEQ